MPTVAHLRELILHLAKRELDATHRFTLLGWTWPLARQLAQLAVLVFIFSSVVDLGIDDFPIFVFSGLVAWAWFSAGITAATQSIVAQRHLAFRSRFPTVVVPVVAVGVALVDVLIALPVLGVMLAASGELYWTILLVPALLAVQLVLMTGIAWVTAAATVYLRDIQQLVLVAVTLLFYMTPIFYDVSRAPDSYEQILRLNPLTPLIEGHRSLMIDQQIPDLAPIGIVAAVACGVAAIGYRFFRRLEGSFVDEL